MSYHSLFLSFKADLNIAAMLLRKLSTLFSVTSLTQTLILLDDSFNIFFVPSLLRQSLLYFTDLRGFLASKATCSQTLRFFSFSTV